MSFEKIAEQKIREAMAEGKFDGLPRAGAIDLEGYFQLPPDLRMAFSILKSAHCVPEEVDLLRSIGQLKEEIARAGASERPALARQLADLELRLSLALERRPTRG